jgi:hypothetical protein
MMTMTMRFRLLCAGVLVKTGFFMLPNRLLREVTASLMIGNAWMDSNPSEARAIRDGDAVLVPDLIANRLKGLVGGMDAQEVHQPIGFGTRH